MEERLEKKSMSPAFKALLLAVGSWISPQLGEKIKCM
jgi:hypothetical protein